MKKYRVIMYKAKWFDDSLVDNTIDTWTMLVNLPYVLWREKFDLKEVKRFIKWCYAHVEIWVPHYNSPTEPRAIDWWNGHCYTSTMRDGEDGTTFRSVREVIYDTRRWDYVELEADTHEEFRRALHWAAREVATNQGYSTEDIKTFIPIARHFVKKNKRNICSEFVDKFMVKCKNFLEHRMMSPRRQAYIIFKELGKEFRSVETL
jgi:hypothetical protein